MAAVAAVAAEAAVVVQARACALVCISRSLFGSEACTSKMSQRVAWCHRVSQGVRRACAE